MNGVSGKTNEQICVVVFVWILCRRQVELHSSNVNTRFIRVVWRGG